MKQLLVICGPTATGKTALALKLAKQFGGELISADSRQIYKGMDIGTGKDLPRGSKIRSELVVAFKNNSYKLPSYLIDGIPLWMYDVVNPDEAFSLSHYFSLASWAIADIHRRGKLPIVVGGAGLYINSLIEQVNTLGIAPNHALRTVLAKKSLSDLQHLLQKEAPEIWKTLNNSDQKNPRRLIRKIEISRNKNPRENTVRSVLYDAFIVGLMADTKLLNTQIDARVDERVNQGIIDEVKGLVSRGYSWSLPSMSGLGYDQWRDFLTSPADTISKQKVIEQWKVDEHKYAKRQMTWFKKQKNIAWFDVSSPWLAKEVTAKVEPWYTQER